MEQLILNDHFAKLLASLLLSLIAYFIKQLHTDFKKVVKELAELRAANNMLYAQTQATNKALNQRLDFMEWRLDLMEPLIRTDLITKTKKNNETEQ